MAYATPAQVRDAVAPDPTDVSGTPGELPDPVLAGRVATASAQVDAALNDRYLVPFAVPPQLIVDITIGIAGYLAALTYRKSVDLPVTDPIYLRYVWATGMLKDLRTGAANLPGNKVVTPRHGGVVSINPYSGTLFVPDNFGLNQPTQGGQPARQPPFNDDWY